MKVSQNVQTKGKTVRAERPFTNAAWSQASLENVNILVENVQVCLLASVCECLIHIGTSI